MWETSAMEMHMPSLSSFSKYLGVALETPAYDNSKPEEHLGEKTIVKLNLKRMLIDRVWRTRQDFFVCLHIDVQVLV